MMGHCELRGHSGFESGKFRPMAGYERSDLTASFYLLVIRLHVSRFRKRRRSRRPKLVILSVTVPACPDR